MTKPVIKPENLRRASAAYTEVYNQDGLTVWAAKSGKFELKCGSTTTVAKNLMDIADKVDNLSLASFPGSGSDVVAAIKEAAASKYQLEIRSSKGGTDKVVHLVEGSLDKISDGLTGVASINVKELVAGRRYAMQQNMYGGEYMILVPMSSAMMELDTGFQTPELYENQVFGKGMVLHGICPKNSDIITVLVAEAYPNGSFKDADGRVWSADDVSIFQFAIGQPAIAEEPFQEPDDALYVSEDLPTYNPVGVVKEQAPMIGNLVNYDTILTASADVISDFMKTCKKVAYLDKSSLNKVTVSAVNGEGQATDGAIEWNVRLGSPNYKRVSMVTIPLIMANGSIDLGKEFITSTGAKFPLTPEAVHAHLGTLAEEDMFRRGSKETNQIFPSTLKISKAMDAVFAGVLAEDAPPVPMSAQVPVGADADKQNDVSASKKTAATTKTGLVVGIGQDATIISLDLDTSRGHFAMSGNSFYAVPTTNVKYSDDLINDVISELGDDAYDKSGELSNRFWEEYNQRAEDAGNTGGYIQDVFSVNGVQEVPVNGVYYAFDLTGTGQILDSIKDLKEVLIEPEELNTILSAWEKLHLKNVKDPVNFDDEAARLDEQISTLEQSQAADPNDWDAKLLKKLKQERKDLEGQIGTFSPEYSAGMEAEEALIAIWDKYPTSEQLMKAIKLLHPESGKNAAKKTAATPVWYFFSIGVQLDESSAKEDGLDLDALSKSDNGMDAITDAALKIEDNVLSWLNKNVGSVVSTGHNTDDTLGGNIYVDAGSAGHKTILSALEDEGAEPLSTTKGDLPFDPYDGVSDELASVFNVSLSFQRVNNQPEENIPDYATLEAGVTASKKTDAGLRDNQVEMMANSFAKNILMYKEDIDKGELTVAQRAEEILDTNTFAGFPQFSDLNRQQISDLVRKKLADGGISAEDIDLALAVLAVGFDELNTKSTNNPVDKKAATEEPTQDVATYTLGVILWNADSEMTEETAKDTFGKYGTVINFENEDGLVQFGLQVTSREQALNAATMADKSEDVIDSIVQGQWGTIAENHGDYASNYEFVSDVFCNVTKGKKEAKKTNKDVWFEVGIDEEGDVGTHTVSQWDTVEEALTAYDTYLKKHPGAKVFVDKWKRDTDGLPQWVEDIKDYKLGNETEPQKKN